MSEFVLMLALYLLIPDQSGFPSRNKLAAYSTFRNQVLNYYYKISRSSKVDGYGMPPPLPLLILDPGGRLNTLHWTSALPRLSLDDSTARALRILRYGLISGDLAAIGEAASLSAKAYQPILPSALVEQALPLVPIVGALGVVRAHSGPITGLLFAHEREANEAWPILAKAFPNCEISLTTLTAGGVSIKESIKDNEYDERTSKNHSLNSAP